MNILLLIANVMAYTKSDFKHIAVWEQQPAIVMCKDTKVKDETLEKAINFWKQIGYDVPESIAKKYCGHELHVPGEIRITGQRNLDTVRYYGMTDRNYYSKNRKAYMLSVNIKLEVDASNNLELLIHEIGHALGIEHENHDESHIMHHLAIENSTRYN